MDRPDSGIPRDSFRWETALALLDENQWVQLCQVFASWAFSIMEAILVAI